jgi:hypothetical protein
VNARHSAARENSEDGIAIDALGHVISGDPRMVRDPFGSALHTGKSVRSREVGKGTIHAARKNMRATARHLATILPLFVIACAGSTEEPSGEKDEDLFGSSDPHANIPSPNLPSTYVQHARERRIVAVAGANAGTQVREWLARGWGTEAEPFRRVQSLEAVTALHELAGSNERRIWAWGYGPEVDQNKKYFYRAISGTTFELHFVGTDVVATAYGDLTKFGETSVRDDATNLRAALDAAPEFRGERLMIVGCSWGAAIVDYGMTRTPSRNVPSPTEGSIFGDVVAMAIAGPLDLPTRLQPWPFVRMSWDGDYDGKFLVRRRPDDLVGKGGLHPLRSQFRGPTHNYTLAWHDANGTRVPGGFWGISGPGMLCPAAYDDDCP